MNSAIADSGEFWWDIKQPDQSSLWESKIELGEKFFHEVITNPVPLVMHILRATYRTFNLKCQLRLTWPLLYRQFGADPAQGGRQVDCERFPKRLSARAAEDSARVAGPALPDGHGGAAALTVAAAHRAVAAAPRGIVPSGEA